MRLGGILTLAGCMLALGGGAIGVAGQSAKGKESPGLKKADAAFHAGFAAQQAGNLKEARAHFQDVVRLAPQIAEGHEALGTVLLQLGQAAGAIRELETANRLKRDDPGNEQNLAVAYAQAGQPARAIPHFEAVVRLSQKPGASPLSGGFYDAYGRALLGAGRPQQALEQFKAEEALGARRADLDDEIGSLYAQQGKWDEARAAFKQAIAENAADVPARIHLGIVLRHQNDLQGSLDALGIAAKSEPPNANAFLEYGRTLAAAGRDDDASRQFESALKVDPHLPGAALELAMALQRLGRQQDAIPWFEQAVAQDPHNTSALTNLGLALTLTGKAKESLDDFRQATALQPENPVIYKDMGVAHLQLSAFDEAIADFEKALSLDASDPQTHYDLGLAYKFKDRFQDAIAQLTRAERLDPTLQDPPYTLGILLMQIGRLDDAVTELKKAVALRPQNGDAWAILGSTLKQDERLKEAADALRKAIPLLPGQPGPRVTLAGVLAEQAAALSTQADAAESAGDAQKAAALRSQRKTLMGEVVELRREGAELARGAVNRQRANFAMNAGNQLMLRGQIADAIQQYQQAVAADPTFADPHKQLAIAYERQGRAQEAAEERAKAEELEAKK